jgi:YegS/Rv2252/BmrU family lipid kinase
MNKCSFRRIGIVMNPAAGGWLAEKWKDRIAELLAPAEVIIRLTEGPGQGGALAGELLSQCDLIIAAGGDGTLNEVIGAMPENSNLGLIPFGTANVVAAEFGIPSNNPEAACSIIRNGIAKPVDIGVVNSRPFIMSIGIGPDAEICREVSGTFKRHLGKGAFAIKTLAYLISKTPTPHLVTLPDGREIQSFFTIGLNTSRYAGPRQIVREARVDDGKFDLVIFRKWLPMNIIMSIAGFIILKKPLTANRNIHHISTEGFILSNIDKDYSINGKTIPYQVDGEVAGTLPATVKMQCSWINLIH